MPQPSTPPHPLCFQALSTSFHLIPPFSTIYAWSQYVHYLLVHPLYQGCGVGSRLLELCKKRYAGYLNVVLTSYREGVPFYERNGFIADRTQEAMRFIPPSSGETGL